MTQRAHGRAPRFRARWLALAWLPAAMLAALAACGVLDVAQAPQPGGRVWVIPVTNDAALPAVLSVAEDTGAQGRIVGTADPPRVAPGAGWAIFVNPGPETGPLILASDVPGGASGALPLHIQVARDGSPSVSAPAEPGWFGN
jgi:hypothetical protein